jgi:amino acid permease
MLTMPILFRSSGMVTGSIILIVSGLISFITCRIYVIHMSAEDRDVEWTIRRLLGSKWEKRFRFITGFYLILLCVIYIDLIVDQLYSVIYFFFESNGHADAIAPKDGFMFDRFSTQWLTLILFCPLLALVFIKRLNLMVKLSEYGSYSALIYFIFVVVKFFAALADGTIDLDNVHLISWDVGNLAGTCALAFTIHTMVITFVKENKDQTKNERDVAFSYMLGFLLYELIGLFGGFAVSDIDCKETLVNCYMSEWTVLIVELSYLFGRITVFPCTLEVSRTRLIELYVEKVEDRHFKFFNIAFMVFASVMSILSPFIPISLMMNIVGAVVCYFFIYLFPTLLHYTCLYKQKVDE